MTTQNLLLIISYKDGVFIPENLPGLPISSTSAIINNGMTGLLSADFLIALTDILRDEPLSGYSFQTAWIDFEGYYHVVLTRDGVSEAPSTPSTSSSFSFSTTSSATSSLIINDDDIHDAINHTQHPTEWYMGEESHFQNFFDEEEQEAQDEEQEQVQANGLSATIGWPTTPTSHTTSTDPSPRWHTFALDGSVLDSDSVPDLDCAFDTASERSAHSHPRSSQSHYGWEEFADLAEDDDVVVVVAVSGSHITTTTNTNSNDDDNDDGTDGNGGTTSLPVAAGTTAADNTHRVAWYPYALDEVALDSDTESVCGFGPASERSADSLLPPLPTLSPRVRVCRSV
ncbi:hypothetical protein BDW42DRAFT_193703 [Aspergillus taichungensis]|uniref:Uncharacterized protein n=1 Tax=Aspergillus taichungensis TaxID=482145 RepID=A0A2J5HVP1_9EURO|nr:hypothetical protein BDW42DRAFT_193703 [Aspergillus taichungensis]